jgi:hypothetical protein
MALMASPAQSSSGAKQVTMLAANAAEMSKAVGIPLSNLAPGSSAWRQARGMIDAPQT